jgi:hypothetical protein
VISLTGEQARHWWEQLGLWERDEVQDWWCRLELVSPFGPGANQAAASLGVSGKDEVTHEVNIFLQGRFGLRPPPPVPRVAG